jgi:hypothetical protein
MKGKKMNKVINLETLVNAYLGASDKASELQKINEQKKLISKKYGQMRRTVSDNTVETMVLFFQGLAVNKVATAATLISTIKDCGGDISDSTVSRYKAIGGAVARVADDGKVTREIKKLADKTLNLMISDSKTYGVKTIETIDSIERWNELVTLASVSADDKAVERVCKAIREGRLDGSDVLVSIEQAIKDAEQLAETLQELSA